MPKIPGAPRAVLPVTLVVALGLLLASCSPVDVGTPAPPPPDVTAPSPVSPAAPSPASPVAASPASPTAAPAAGASPTAASSPTPTPIAGPAYDNPVYPRDFPDPHVLLVGDTYYAYSTNVSPSHVPVITSTDLVEWERAGDAMPLQAAWARKGLGLTWAPGVIQLDQGFALYFTARDEQSDRQCIGVATADAPDGQFESQSDEPFICQAELGGSIDAYPFRDGDGTLYLYWKNDGNCCGLPVGLWVQELSADGVSLVGERRELIQRDQPWERPLIENPAMVENEGDYYLFYSANWWEGIDYAVGYAVCQSPTGPCEKPLDEPIFSATAEATGPGGQSFFHDTEGNLWMAYHAWTGARVGYPRGERSLRIEPVEFEDGQPVIEGPTTGPQPMP